MSSLPDGISALTSLQYLHMSVGALTGLVRLALDGYAPHE